MSLDFINRIIRTSLVLAAVLFPFLAVYISIAFAIAYILSCIWACLNLFAIKFLIVRLITPEPKNKVLLAIFLLIKFPIIYFLGYLLVAWSYLPIYGLVWGFSSILAVSVLKVLSRQLLQLDSKPQVKML